MKIQTGRFGELEVLDDRIISFPEGMPGFEGRRFTLINSPENEIIDWLQSVDEPEIALMTTDPDRLLIDYRANPKPAEMNPILPEGDVGEEILTRVIIRNSDRPGELFVNLFAPVLINVPRRLGMQVPLVGSGYSVREVWPPRAEDERT